MASYFVIDVLSHDFYIHVREEFYRCPHCRRVNENFSSVFYSDQITDLECWNCGTVSYIRESKGVVVFAYGGEPQEHKCSFCQAMNYKSPRYKGSVVCFNCGQFLGFQ